MATTRLIPMHSIKGQSVVYTVHERLDYAMNPRKTRGGELVMAYGCDPATAANEMLLKKKEYAAFTGKEISKSDILLYQIRQSFKPGEVTPEQAQQIGYALAMSWTKGKHQFVVATHIDHAHIHTHIIYNATRIDAHHKYRNFLGSSMALRRASDRLCLENKLSIVEQPRKNSAHYGKWLGSAKKPRLRDELRAAIDQALEKGPGDLQSLFDLLCEAGIQVDRRGKSIRLKAPGWDGVARMSSLGSGYTEDDLAAVLAGKKKHTPREKNAAPADPPKVNLLVDIQAKLAEGKGAGYARWAASFNLKQMANTLNYLTENRLLDYGALCEKTDAATARFHDLSGKIKAAEARMSEIAELKTQIINYSKTREVYAAYRKAGYSKKFLAEHEREILLHKAAKKAFDELGLKKLPTVKSLQAEYAELLAEKKRAYSEYRSARDEMQNLQMARANVARIMGYDDRAPTMEKKQKTHSHDTR